MEIYKKHIIKMINSIENMGVLEYLDRFIELFIEKWG